MLFYLIRRIFKRWCCAYIWTLYSVQIWTFSVELADQLMCHTWNLLFWWLLLFILPFSYADCADYVILCLLSKLYCFEGGANGVTVVTADCRLPVQSAACKYFSSWFISFLIAIYFKLRDLKKIYIHSSCAFVRDSRSGLRTESCMAQRSLWLKLLPTSRWFIWFVLFLRKIINLLFCLQKQLFAAFIQGGRISSIVHNLHAYMLKMWARSSSSSTFLIINYFFVSFQTQQVWKVLCRQVPRINILNISTSRAEGFCVASPIMHFFSGLVNYFKTNSRCWLIRVIKS